MKKIDLKNIFERKTRRVDSGPAAAWPVNFIRDWKTVVLIFALGLISLSVFAWQIYLSNEIAGGYLAGTTVDISNSPVQTIDQKRLQSDILMMETRQADYLKLKTGSVKMIDPSL